MMLRLTTLLTPLVLSTAAASGSCLSTKAAPGAEQSSPSVSRADDIDRNEPAATPDLSSRSMRCDNNWACIDPVQTGNQLRFFVENRRAVPITLTLRIDANQVHGNDRRVVTATVDGDSRANFITLTAVHADTDIRYRYRFDWTVGKLDAEHDDHHVYRLPYASGSSYQVLQTYGSRFSHTGYERYAIDFNMREGTPVYAARGGVVARLEESHNKGCWADGCSEYANFLVVLHDDGTTSEYYHLQQDGVLVEEGALVRPGQEIARSGNTGHTTMPHLHFAVYKAASWGNTQSIPVRFETTAGVIERPRRGGAYVAP